MSIKSFLYRRLSRWITCELKLQEDSKIALETKYEVASFKDVFCHPFYWQVFQWVNHPPNLVVDCGAHCGHFSILADICFRSKFGTSTTKYILIEPNPYLIPVIRKNLIDTALNERTELKQGLLGVNSGQGTLWINQKNYLATSTHFNNGCKPYKLQYLNLLEIVGDHTIDLLKVDIEGGEFKFINSNLDLLRQVKLIFMELHEAPKKLHKELFDSLSSVGLHLVKSPIEINGQQLIIFQR